MEKIIIQNEGYEKIRVQDINNVVFISQGKGLCETVIISKENIDDFIEILSIMKEQ